MSQNNQIDLTSDNEQELSLITKKRTSERYQYFILDSLISY